MKVLTLEAGKKKLIDLSQSDFLSGFSVIELDEVVVIPSRKQSISFISLTLDGTINLEGDLWLA